jgi:hypothetical protein
MEHPMSQLNDLSRSLTSLEQGSTIIAVIEMGQSSWLVAGIVPGIERHPLKKLEPSEEELIRLLMRWRAEATEHGGSDHPSGCPAEPLVSYWTNRQLSGWILPPLMIRAFGAHCHSGLMQCSKDSGCNPSLDHRVGAGDERRRHGEPQRRRGPEIDHQLESCWLRGIPTYNDVVGCDPRTEGSTRWRIAAFPPQRPWE